MVIALSSTIKIETPLTQDARLNEIQKFLHGWSGSMGKTSEGHQIIFLSYPDHYAVTVNDAPTKGYNISRGGTVLDAQLQMMDQNNARPHVTSNEYTFKLTRRAQPTEGTFNTRFIDPGLVDNFLQRVEPGSIGPYSDA